MKNKIKVQILCLFLSILIVPNVFGQTEITKANRAYRGCDYVTAKKIYESVTNNQQSSDEDKIASYRKLAFFAWKINGNIEESTRIIEAAFDLDKTKVNLLHDLANYQLQAHDFAEAKHITELAIQATVNKNQMQEFKMLKANIVLQEAIYLLNNDQPIEKEVISEALKSAEAINKEEVGNLDHANIQLGLALLMKDGTSAFNAWKNYFRIPTNQKAKGMLSTAEDQLQKALLNSADEFDADNRKALIIGLANSRFYNYADLMSRYLPLSGEAESDDVNDIKEYYNFCLKVDALSNNYHRNIILNASIDNARASFYDQLSEIKQQLWSKLSWKSEEQSFNDSNFEDELYQRFGTIFKDVKPYYTFHGKTGLFFFAHSVSDENISVEQYNYKADVHFVVLDFMFANSLDGWFLEDKTGLLGGWNDKSLIIQMRRAYSDRPILYWDRITDQQQKTAWEERIAELRIADEEIAKNKPISYLPGLLNSMRYQASLKLKKSLEEQGLEGDDLRMAFISTFESNSVNASIYGHEGRHRIDGKYRLIFEPFCRNYEYRAKLSEVLFSDDPIFTLAFSSVYIRQLEGNSKHAYGSKKIITQLVEWMKNNQDEIAGFNAQRPILPQLDLLTEAQLIKAFNKMEPLNSWRRKINPKLIILLIGGVVIWGFVKLIRRRRKKIKNK